MQAIMLLFDGTEELEVMRLCGLAETEMARYINGFVTTYKWNHT